MKKNYLGKIMTTLLVIASFNSVFAQWTPSTGIAGSNCQRFIKLGHKIFVGTDGSGIWKSEDDGLSWEAASNGLDPGTDFSITELAIMAPSTLIASTYDNGVFKSVDSGATWSSITGTLVASTLYPAKNVAANGTMVIVGIESQGVFHTSNGGTTWSLDTLGIGLYNYTNEIAIVGDTAFICTSKGLFKSSITTFSWFHSNTGLPGAISLSSFLNQNDTLYLGSSANGVYRSVNNGRSWTSINTTATQGSQVYSVIATSTKIYLNTAGGIYESPKSTIKWTLVGDGLASKFPNDIIMSDTYLLAGTGIDGPYYFDETAPATSITVNGTTLTSFSATGNQWYLNGNLIVGATSQDYIYTQNGTYTVKVTSGGNTVTSDPFVVTTVVGIVENSLSTLINIYPNPFSSQTTISFFLAQVNTNIKIVDLLGNVLRTINFTGTQLSIEKGDLITGVYFVQIMDANKNVLNKKLVFNKLMTTFQ